MMAAGISLLAGAAAADQPRVYAYPSHENYCPAGLQPVTISGVICCGTPNQSVSYQHMMAHAAPRKHKPRTYSARPSCREGEKGCS